MKRYFLCVLAGFAGFSILCGLGGCAKTQPKGAHAGHDHGEAAEHLVVKNGVEFCAEHDVPEAECAVCKPDLAPTLKAGEGLQLRLPSEQSETIIGVRTALPQTGSMADVVECMGELSYDLNKLARISAQVSGIVHSVELDLGAVVKEGQAVARIWSASSADTVAKAVLARQNLQRERRLWAGQVTTAQALEEAAAADRAAGQLARTLGFTDAEIDALGSAPNDPVYLDVRAPFAGEIVERTAVLGERVEAGAPLFTVVDPSVMWAMLQVPETALARVQVGQTVELRVPSLPGKVFKGAVTWISLAVDERTRMGRVRAQFANDERLLRDKLFVDARVLTQTREGALLVPHSAIQYVEEKAFVFVKEGAGLYEARAVLLGSRNASQQEVLSGLRADEAIAVTHTFAVKSAMLMARLGAGCADD